MNYGDARGGGIRSNCQGNKKALLIGINYFGQSGELKGCINDVNNIKRLIMSRGFRDGPSHMRVLTDDSRNPADQPTRRNIIEGELGGSSPSESHCTTLRLQAYTGC